MLKQDPSLLHPAEIVQALRHHLQAMENALQEASQNAERQLAALRQADEALSNLDGQLGRISNSLLQADPSRPEDLLSRLKEALPILEQQAPSQAAGEALTLVGEMLGWIQERIELEKLRNLSIGDLLEQKQFRKALPAFAIGSGVVSFLFFLLLVGLGASAGDAFGAVFWANVLGYIGFFLRGMMGRS
ncbi:hypothetical protein [Thermoflexus hugenholtzii]